MTPTATLQQLADREAIGRLPAMYCHYVRTQDIDGILSLFAEDGEFEVLGAFGNTGGAIRNGAALRAMFEKGFAAARPWPVVQNLVVDLDSDCTASSVACAEIRSGTLDLRIVGVGTYRDRYVRSERGEWKFSRREFNGEAL